IVGDPSQERVTASVLACRDLALQERAGVIGAKANQIRKRQSVRHTRVRIRWLVQLDDHLRFGSTGSELNEKRTKHLLLRLVRCPHERLCPRELELRKTLRRQETEGVSRKRRIGRVDVRENLAPRSARIEFIPAFQSCRFQLLTRVGPEGAIVPRRQPGKSLQSGQKLRRTQEIPMLSQVVDLAPAVKIEERRRKQRRYPRLNFWRADVASEPEQRL